MIARFWKTGLVTLTVTENVSGFAASVAVLMYLKGDHSGGRTLGVVSLIAMLGSLAVIITGQLFKRDHGQAGPVLPYVTFGLLALGLLAVGFD